VARSDLPPVQGPERPFRHRGAWKSRRNHLPVPAIPIFLSPREGSSSISLEPTGQLLDIGGRMDSPPPVLFEPISAKRPHGPRRTPARPVGQASSHR